MLQCFGSQEKLLHDPPPCPLQALKCRGGKHYPLQEPAVEKQGMKTPCPTNPFPSCSSKNQMRINLLLQLNQKLQE